MQASKPRIRKLVSDTLMSLPDVGSATPAAIFAGEPKTGRVGFPMDARVALSSDLRPKARHPATPMATQAHVRRIAMSLPAVVEADTDFAFSVPTKKGKLKGFAWVWKERITPKKPRVPNPGVIAVRVANVAQRDLLISADPAKFFTEPHYEGFPAVLVRLKAVRVADLEMLLEEGWRCMASAELTKRTKTAE